MRLPFLQVAEEAWGKARVLSGLLGIPRQHALGLLCDLWAWAVDLGPQDQPPSGEVTGTSPDLVLAAAVEWTKAPAELVAALSHPAVAVLEHIEDGLRVRGMDRYAAAWCKQQASRERVRAFRAARSEPKALRNADETRTKRERNDFVQPDTQTQTQTYIETKEALSTSVDPLQQLWNEKAHDSLPRCRELSAKRAKKAKARWAERPESVWLEVIAKINHSPFCLGENDRGWRADFDWLLQPDTAAKVLEGKYDARQAAKPKASNALWWQK